MKNLITLTALCITEQIQNFDITYLPVTDVHLDSAAFGTKIPKLLVSIDKDAMVLSCIDWSVASSNQTIDNYSTCVDFMALIS